MLSEDLQRLFAILGGKNMVALVMYAETDSRIIVSSSTTNTFFSGVIKIPLSIKMQNALILQKHYTKIRFFFNSTTALHRTRKIRRKMEHV